MPEEGVRIPFACPCYACQAERDPSVEEQLQALRARIDFLEESLGRLWERV